MNKALKEKCISLRKDGYSYSYIIKQTNVSKSTLSNWLHDISYNPNEFTRKTIGKARSASALAKNKIRQESVKKALELAENDIDRLTRRDLFMLGLGIYIGEGSKSIVQVRIVNSNDRVIGLMIRWFVEICNVPKENLFIRIHSYPNKDIDSIQKFWHEKTRLPYSQFQKVYIDRRSGKKNAKDGTHDNGTAHLSVKSLGLKNIGVFFTRRLLNWIDIVLEC